jgi:hypothetical protein
MRAEGEMGRPMMVFKPFRSILPQRLGGISLKPQVNWILILFVTIFEGAEEKLDEGSKPFASPLFPLPLPGWFFSRGTEPLVDFPCLGRS